MNSKAGAANARDGATKLGATNTSVAVTIVVVVPQPLLTIAHGFNRIFLTWPESSPGFQVERTTNLVPPLVWVVWLTLAQTPFVQDGLFQVVIPIGNAGTQRFFRGVAP